MKRPTRRTILKVIALLAAGAAVNVAVAWGLANLAQWPNAPHANGLYAVEGWGIDSFYLIDLGGHRRSGSVYGVGRRLGWPLRSVSFAGSGFTWAKWLDGDRGLEVSLIVPGFAVNTVFYAAVLWVVFAIPGALRRMIRSFRGRRGQCPACGYPVGTNERCTECGAAVTGVSIDLQSDTAPQVPRSAKP